MSIHGTKGQLNMTSIASRVTLHLNLAKKLHGDIRLPVTTLLIYSQIILANSVDNSQN